MTPPPDVATRPTAHARSSTAPPGPARAPEQRPPLRVIPSSGRAPGGAWAGRWPLVLATVVLFGTLMAVVVAHAMLAQRQIELATAQSALTSAQAVHSSRELSVAQLETPSRILAEATQLHLGQPAQIIQVPSVSLQKPVPAPTFGSSGTAATATP